MTIFEHWEPQREILRGRLKDLPDTAAAVYEVKHALNQTEQNALAELRDETLRQQAGVLFSCMKNAAGLLDVQVSHQVWVAQKVEANPKKPFPLLHILSAGVQAALAIYAWFIGAPFLAGGVVVAAGLELAALLTRKKPAASLPPDQVNVTITPDTDKLLTQLDSMMRVADRCVNDFTYLNDQLQGGQKTADSLVIGKAADLVQALYECEEEGRKPAEEAAASLLSCLGLKVLDYSQDSSNYFNLLPSKKITRTLSPAILSASDGKLLRRGTAAVLQSR